MRLIAAVLCCALGLLAQTPRFFVQGSDPQFGMFAENRNFQQETANFEFFVANVNRLRPAFVVICGDLVNRAGDADQIAEYKRIARKLDGGISLYNVPGNHDVGNEPTSESIALYRKNFGPDYYTFRSGDLTGIVLDSSLIKAPEKAPDEARKQEQWLRDELLKVGAGRVVVFQHHPYFLESPDEPDQYFNIPKETRVRYLALFRQYGVKFVFAGHYHRNAFGRDGDLEMITTGPIGKPIGPDPSGFRIVQINPDGLEQKYYGLGTIPNVLKFTP
ncbi:MAG: metallophosphoesterase [Acidobacteriota bacterium]|nr:metallophosphoesterase [Acidobacteriota bacterium]